MRQRKLCGSLALLVVTTTFGAPGAVRAEGAPPPAAIDIQVPDALLQDQSGKRVQLVREVLAGKTVALNFIFTTCTTICPPMGANFAKLAKLLAERRDPSLQLVSISVDPLTDTPERLTAWRNNFGTTQGWTLLTGDKQTVTQVLKAMGAFTGNKVDHAPIALVGNADRGTWQRIYGLTPPAEMMRIMDEVAAADPTRKATP